MEKINISDFVLLLLIIIILFILLILLLLILWILVWISYHKLRSAPLKLCLTLLLLFTVFVQQRPLTVTVVDKHMNKHFKWKVINYYCFYSAHIICACLDAFMIIDLKLCVVLFSNLRSSPRFNSTSTQTWSSEDTRSSLSTIYACKPWLYGGLLYLRPFVFLPLRYGA